MRLKDSGELVHDFGTKTSCGVRCNSKVLQMSSCSLQLFTRHSSWLLCVIVADLTAHARALNSLRAHTCFLSKLIFDSDLRIFLWIRMMDPGKKRMITLKKSERDRKKLNESILKKLKTLDAEVAGASIVSWFLHSFSREPGIMLSCSNGLWEPNSFMWSVWTIERNNRSHKVLCALRENGTEITRGLSYLIKDSSFWITFICCKMPVAFCTHYQNFQQ